MEAYRELEQVIKEIIRPIKEFRFSEQFWMISGL